MAYTTFLNGYKSGRFTFSWAEHKEMMLAEALRKATDFIRVTKICADSSDAPKETNALGDKNFNRGNRSPGPWGKRRNLRRLTLGLPPMLRASSWRLKGMQCYGDRLL